MHHLLLHINIMGKQQTLHKRDRSSGRAPRLYHAGAPPTSAREGGGNAAYTHALTRVGLAVGSSRCTLSSHNSPVDEDLVEDLCPGGAGRQLKPSSLELAPQHRQRLGREVAAEVLVRRQGVRDAEPHAARPREVAGRGDAQGLVHGQRGVVREESEQELGQRLRIARGRRAPIGTPGFARSALNMVAFGKERQRVEPRQHGRRGHRLQIVDDEEHLVRRGSGLESGLESGLRLALG